VQLAGFSTHYNISFELPRNEQGTTRTVEQLAYLLTHILPVPVMLLAANRRSTGIGVRPRGDRIEITADFTPDAPLMIATATVIVGIVREVMRWPSYEISVLDETDIPVIRGFRPMPHTTRKGWLARFDCYPENPFVSDIDGDKWPTTDGRFLSLRAIAGQLPPLDALTAGCIFAPRCPLVQPRCTAAEVPLYSANGSLVRCVLQETATDR